MSHSKHKKRIISLIGYRATGKSTISEKLGKSLGMNVVDSDEQVISHVGKSIKDIFTSEGENAFRRYEEEIIKSILESQDSIILSTGGGSILNPETRACLKQAGPVIWLKASQKTIIKRLLEDPQTTINRPALTPHDLETEVAEILTVRTPLYRECATIEIDTDNKTVEIICEEINAALLMVTE